MDRTTLYRWRIRSERAEGAHGLFRAPGSGRPRKLQDFTSQLWRDIVLQPASTSGFETDFWTAKRLHQVVTEQWAADVTVRTILRRLKEAGLTYQKSTREYCEADPVAPQQWLQVTLPKIRAAIGEYRAILYCEDEASISLTALLGKTWAPRGQTPSKR